MATKNKLYHSLPLSDVFDELDVNTDGLNYNQIEFRKNKYGSNILDKVDKESLFTLFINQFKDFIVIILIFAVLISAILGNFIDAFAIILILFLNAMLGFYQEYQAEKSIEALQDLTHPETKIKRSGNVLKIDSVEIVPGDIVLLEAGDLVPADCRIINSFNLQIDESTFTGESEPVIKDFEAQIAESTPISDQLNMLFMGTNILRGTATVVVVNTGMSTIMGGITEMLITAESRDTPLKIKLNEFGHRLGWVILGISAIVVIIGVLAQNEFTIPIFLDMLIIGVALAVAAVPEGLPAVVTLALSIGVLRMSRQQAIVRKLRAVETLGSTTVICSDKTGTLTQNKMTVEEISLAPFDESIRIISDKSDEYGMFVTQTRVFNPPLSPNLQLLMKTAVLVNNSQITADADQNKYLGDPTELALVIAGAKADVHKEKIEKDWLRIMELPFDSNRKMMTTIHELSTSEGKKTYIVLVKGAPDIVREHSTHVQVDTEILPLQEKLMEDLIKSEISYANRALRVLAFGFKTISKNTLDEFRSNKVPDYSKIENNFIFLGLIGMRDPPRPEAIKAIKVAQIAGIRVVMITGDHKNTAMAIGQQMGLISSSDRASVLTGKELLEMDKNNLQEKVKNTKIFARVTPEQKLNIVEALQANGEIVAVTGDGVNDAPALKQADIGVAMGMAGTDVAKQASDMILIDDNFATLESAIEEGRSIFSNMKKFIGYLLACNAGEVITVFFGIIILSFVAGASLGASLTLEELLPLTALQLLYINLLTDGLPALALGIDPKEDQAMLKPPRDPNESIFNKHMLSSILLAGSIVGFGTLFIFFLELNLSLDPSQWVIKDSNLEITGGTIMKARTMAFTVLIFFQKAMALSSRSETESLFSVGVFRNKALWGSILFTAFIHILVIYLPPLQDIFGTVELSMNDWIVVLLLASTVFFAEETRKFIFRRKFSIETKNYNTSVS